MSTEKQNIQAFNNGYTLQKYKHDLAESISGSLLPNTEYLKAFFAGIAQADTERVQDKISDLQNLRNQNSGRENNFERESG